MILKKKQVEKLVGYKYVMAGMANILIIKDNNWFLFKNNVKYI